MSKIKNGGSDQCGTEPFEQQQFGTADFEGLVKAITVVSILPYAASLNVTLILHCENLTVVFSELRQNCLLIRRRSCL